MLDVFFVELLVTIDLCWNKVKNEVTTDEEKDDRKNKFLKWRNNRQKIKFNSLIIR